MRLEYNSPVILTYALISAAVLILSKGVFPGLIELFTIRGFNFSSPVNYFQVFSHIAGHISWNHLISNFSFILLLGPLLEEKYGSTRLLIMILVTALITGLLNVVFFPTGLLGASGVVFMFIILMAFANYKSGKIPVTLVLIILLFLGKEIFNALEDDHISQFAHIIGGICGGIFGTMLRR